LYFPITLNVEGKEVAVIGGGEVALRKVKSLLAYGSKITVISPELAEGFKDICNEITYVKELYSETLIRDADIVIAATSSREINREIGKFCKSQRILCNIADDSLLSDFIIPSTIKRGDLLISISTSGKSPSLAGKIKRELEEIYTEEYAEYVHLLGELRGLVLSKYTEPVLKKEILNSLANLSLDELRIRRDECEGCDRIEGE
jgi:precorrin-2 dehydrogenase / sirohydrochlorin ferrochelatase